MKRIIAFLFISILGFGVLYGVRQTDFKIDGLEKVVFVVSDTFESEDEEISIIQSGSDFYISVPTYKAKEVYESLNEIRGYVLYYNNELDKENLVASLMQYQMPEAYVNDIKVITGYTSGYSDYRYVDGKKVNVQVAFTEESVVVGYPLILTGF